MEINIAVMQINKVVSEHYLVNKYSPKKNKNILTTKFDTNEKT